jgi:hypothetical protein
MAVAVPLDISHIYSEAAKITRISATISNNNSWTNGAEPTPKKESAYTSLADNSVSLRVLETAEPRQT